jgi:hypothetical protein
MARRINKNYKRDKGAEGLVLNPELKLIDLKKRLNWVFIKPHFLNEKLSHHGLYTDASKIVFFSHDNQMQLKAGEILNKFTFYINDSIFNQRNFFFNKYNSTWYFAHWRHGRWIEQSNLDDIKGLIHDIITSMGYSPTMSLIGDIVKLYQIKFSRNITVTNDFIQFDNGVLDVKNLKIVPFDYDVIPQLTFKHNWYLVEECPPILKQILIFQYFGVSQYLHFIRGILLLSLTAQMGQYNMLILLEGVSFSGKSLLVNILRLILNDTYTKVTTFEDLEKNRFELGDISSTKLLLINEAPKIMRHIPSQLKSITGNDPVRSEKKFKDSTVGYFNGIVLFTSNYHIVFESATAESLIAMERRICRLRFRRKVVSADISLLKFQNGIASGNLVDELQDIQNWVLSGGLEETKKRFLDKTSSFSNVLSNFENKVIVPEKDENFDHSSFWEGIVDEIIGTFLVSKIRYTGVASDSIPRERVIQLYKEHKLSFMERSPANYPIKITKEKDLTISNNIQRHLCRDYNEDADLISFRKSDKTWMRYVKEK